MNANMTVQCTTLCKLDPTHVAFVRFLPSVSTNVYLQEITSDKLRTTHIAFIRFLSSVSASVFIEVTPICVTVHNTYRIYKVSLQCDFEYGSSGHHSVQIGHHTYHIYKVFPQCECEYASSGHHSVQTGHHTYHMYSKGFSPV